MKEFGGGQTTPMDLYLSLALQFHPMGVKRLEDGDQALVRDASR